MDPSNTDRQTARRRENGEGANRTNDMTITTASSATLLLHDHCDVIIIYVRCGVTCDRTKTKKKTRRKCGSSSSIIRIKKENEKEQQSRLQYIYFLPPSCLFFLAFFGFFTIAVVHIVHSTTHQASENGENHLGFDFDQVFGQSVDSSADLTCH